MRSAQGSHHTLHTTLLREKNQHYAALCDAQDTKPAPFSMQVMSKVSRARRVFLFVSFIKYLPQQDFHERLIRKYAEMLPAFNAKLY